VIPILLMKPSRVVTEDVRGSRHKQITVAAEIVREHAEEIARNSLLRCNTIDGKTVLTVSLSLSNPQPELRERAAKAGIEIDRPD